MPVYGRLDSEAVTDLATITRLARDRVDIESVETLTFSFEVGAEGAFDILPKALHPPAPPYCSITLRRHRDAPVGPFTSAELRLHSRATGLYMGYVLGGFVDSPQAAAWLREAYGSPVKVAETVSLVKRHYGYEARVVTEGRTVLDALLASPGFVSGSDVLYIPNLNLAVYEGARWLVAEEFEYATKEAKRGVARYTVRDLAGLGGAGLTATNELPSTLTSGTWAYENVRYILDPKVPALTGLKKLAEPA
jgi:hypothetical protein